MMQCLLLIPMKRRNLKCKIKFAVKLVRIILMMKSGSAMWKDITAAVLIIGTEIVIRLPENSELSCNLQQFCCACQCFYSTMSRKKDTIALLKRKGVFFCLHRSRTRNAEQNLKGIRIWLVVCPITSGLYGQQCRAEIRALA